MNVLSLFKHMGDGRNLRKIALLCIKKLNVSYENIAFCFEMWGNKRS